ncbi:MAG: hypothetical protein AAF730_15085 [Bacteroidota bacterium]
MKDERWLTLPTHGPRRFAASAVESVTLAHRPKHTPARMAPMGSRYTRAERAIAEAYETA